MNGLIRNLALLLGALACTAAAADSSIRLGPDPPSHPERLVTLAPSLTETVIALGEGNRLIGVSRYDEYPETANLPRVGGYLDPSVEAVVGLRPDLVLAQPSPANRASVEKMGQLGISVLALPMRSVDDVFEAIRAVAGALKCSKRGEELIEHLKASRTAVRAKAKHVPLRRVLFIYGFKPLIVAGRGSFADELLQDVGGVNAVQDAKTPFPVYSVESVLRANPDIVIDAVEGPTEKEALAELSSLKKARWVKIRTQALLHPGPSLESAWPELFDLIHGESR